MVNDLFELLGSMNVLSLKQCQRQYSLSISHETTYFGAACHL